MESSQPGPGQDEAETGSGQNGAGGAMKAPEGCYDEGVCMQGRISFSSNV